MDTVIIANKAGDETKQIEGALKKTFKVTQVTSPDALERKLSERN